MIPKLTNENYAKWAATITLFLRSTTGWQFIERKVETKDIDPKDKTVIKLFYETSSLIIASVSDDLLHLIAIMEDPESYSPAMLWMKITIHFNLNTHKNQF